MKSIAAVAISLRPSRHLLLIQSVAHAVAVGAVMTANLPFWPAVFLVLLVGASMARARQKSSVHGLVLRGDGRLEIVGADGAVNEAVVHSHTVVLSFLVVLLYRQDDRLRSLTLLADSLSIEDFRQVRLWLRWRSGAAVAA